MDQAIRSVQAKTARQAIKHQYRLFIYEDLTREMMVCLMPCMDDCVFVNGILYSANVKWLVTMKPTAVARRQVRRTLKYLCGILRGKRILDDTGMKIIQIEDLL